MTNTCPDVIDAGKYSLKEVAEKLQLSPSTVRRLIKGYIDYKGQRRPPRMKSHTHYNGWPYVTGKEIKRWWSVN